jgi:large subunit ribosomal protein L4
MPENQRVMKVKVVNKAGQETGREIELSDAIFGIEPSEHAVYLAVKQYMANQRQGTHKTKEKWEIHRTTKKAFRQKGTGGARRGSMKSPLVRGGARVFGPKPHDYILKVNKKVKDLARKSALTYKAKDGKIVVIEDFSIDTPKTKDFVAILKGLNLTGSKAVVVMDGATENTRKSAQNIATVLLTEARNLNVYDILNCKMMVLSESAVKSIESQLSNN